MAMSSMTSLFSHPTPPKPSLQPSPLTPSPGIPIVQLFSDSRTHGYSGPTRSVTLHNASSSGAGVFSKSEDGERCAVVGRESLRILRMSDGTEKHRSEHKHAMGRGGHRIDASRNMWASSGLKIDSTLTDVVWAQKNFDNKLLTSARNGELIMWDLQKSGPSKVERKVKEHLRAINKLAYSTMVHHYCATASLDGNLRLWDLRNITKSTLFVHHTSQIRSVVLSPSIQNPLHAITGLDSGTICRWDLRMGQRGIIDRIPWAHTGPVMSLDWCNAAESEGGWLASGSLDATVKVWNLSENSYSKETSGHGSKKPIYTLHASYPVRRIAWRTDYETELAIASNFEAGLFLTSQNGPSPSASLSTHPSMEHAYSNNTSSSISGFYSSDPSLGNLDPDDTHRGADVDKRTHSGDMIEIWDVRREWIAKWRVLGSGREGGVTDLDFADSHALWVSHPSGAFSQMDLRYCEKPIDAVPRVAIAWNPTASFTFVTSKAKLWEVPYDDVDPSRLQAIGVQKIEPHKRLGDRTFMETQLVGTISNAPGADNFEMISALAQRYKLDGADRAVLCQINSEAAFEAHCFDTGRLWLLLQSIIVHADGRENKVPKFPIASPLTLPHSNSAPAEATKLHGLTPSTPKLRSSSSEPLNSVGRGGLESPKKQSLERQQNGVSSSSTAAMSSQRHPLSPLASPSSTHRSPRKSKSPLQYKAKRNFNSSSTQKPRRISSRHTSISGFSSRRTSSSPASSSRNSKRHQIGEGALDDSSSEEVTSVSTTLIEGQTKEVVSPSSPTPPSRFASNPVSEDDNDSVEDERNTSASPPSSSESDVDSSDASIKPARISSSKHPSRSRSSTIASLAAITTPVSTMSRKPLLSGRANSNCDERDTHEPKVKEERAILSDVAGDRTSIKSMRSHKRRSEALSAASVAASQLKTEEVVDYNEIRFLEWNHNAIVEAKERFHNIALSTLREAIDTLADSGDVQMCAMLACIAPNELELDTTRVRMFVEAYIDILTRLRLFNVAAYIRKYSSLKFNIGHVNVERKCQNCGKLVESPSLIRRNGGKSIRTGYTYCNFCRRAATSCAICHLPVREAFFVCIVCSHGGHQECYRGYYMKHPTVRLPSNISKLRGRLVSRNSGPVPLTRESSIASALGTEITDVSSDDCSITGQPCAAGCGHNCWVSLEPPDAKSPEEE